MENARSGLRTKVQGYHSHGSRKFFNLQMDPNDSIVIHSSKLQSLVKLLKDLGETVSDGISMTSLLMSLPSEFSHFHSTAADQQTYENLTERLVIE